MACSCCCWVLLIVSLCLVSRTKLSRDIPRLSQLRLSEPPGRKRPADPSLSEGKSFAALRYDVSSTLMMNNSYDRVSTALLPTQDRGYISGNFR